jgi:carboxymethylenebutenolidase
VARAIRGTEKFRCPGRVRTGRDIDGDSHGSDGAQPREKGRQMGPDVDVPRLEPVRSILDLPGATLETAEIRLFGLPRGATLLLVDEGGLDTLAPELMNRLAEHGFESLAADLSTLSEHGSGTGPAVAALLGALQERGWSHDQIGVVGYGQGGAAALEAARDLNLGAAVSVSPRGVLDVADPMVRSPWLGMFGEHDEEVPLARVLDLEARVWQGPEFSRLVVYPGVGAGFYRATASSLDHAASFDSWQRVVEWLNVRVAPRLSPIAERWAERQHTHYAG